MDRFLGRGARPPTSPALRRGTRMEGIWPAYLGRRVVPPADPPALGPALQ